MTDFGFLVSDCWSFADIYTTWNPSKLAFGSISTLSLSSSGRVGILDTFHSLDSFDRSFDRWFRD
jgi:hypothetical protein